MMEELAFETRAKEVLVDITDAVQEAVRCSGIHEGLCFIFCPHTTAGLTINESADPAVRRDIIRGLDRILGDGAGWEHAEGNSPAHIKASLIGSSVTIGISDGRLVLGTWQGIFLCEFDGPRRRRVWVRLLIAGKEELGLSLPH